MAGIKDHVNELFGQYVTALKEGRKQDATDRHAELMHACIKFSDSALRRGKFPPSESRFGYIFDDVVIDKFMQLTDSGYIDNVRAEDGFSGLFISSVHNGMIDKTRRKKDDSISVHDLREDGDIIPVHTPSTTRNDITDLRKKMLRAARKINPRILPMVCDWLEGFIDPSVDNSYEGLAANHSTEVGTVKSRLHVVRELFGRIPGLISEQAEFSRSELVGLHEVIAEMRALVPYVKPDKSIDTPVPTAAEALKNGKYAAKEHAAAAKPDKGIETPVPTAEDALKNEKHAAIEQAAAAKRAALRSTLESASKGTPLEARMFLRKSRNFGKKKLTEQIDELLVNPPETIGDMLRELRMINGFAAEKLAKKINSHESIILLHEKGEPISITSLRRYIDGIGKCRNPLRLPSTPEGHVQPEVREFLFKLAGLVEPSKSNQDTIMERVTGKIADYRRSLLPKNHLPPVGDILHALLLENSVSKREAVLAQINEKSESKIYTLEMFKSYMENKGNTPAEFIHAVARAKELSVEQEADMLRLPNGPTRKFRDEYRHEMTEPVFQRVLKHPERYPTFGKWLKALRVARELRMEDVGKAIGKSKNTVDALEAATTDPFMPTIERYITFNALGFPCGESNQVLPDIKERFLELAPLGVIETLYADEALLSTQWLTQDKLADRIGLREGQGPSFTKELKKWEVDFPSEENVGMMLIDERHDIPIRRDDAGELYYHPAAVETLLTQPELVELREGQLFTPDFSWSR